MLRGMNVVAEIRAQVTNDARRLVRDRFLVGTVVYIVGVAVLLRFLVPYATRRLEAQVDLTVYYPLLTGYIVLTAASVMTGVLGGMLLLETKEERTLDALRVCPMPVGRLVTYEAAFIYLCTVPLILLQAEIVAVGKPPLASAVVIAASGAAFAPVVAVGVAQVAADKVEAFVWLKTVGFVALVASAVWFVPEPFQWVAILAPPYAATKAWWLAASGQDGWALWAGLGLMVNGLLLALLVRRWTGPSVGQ